MREGKICRLRPDIRTCRIYNGRKRDHRGKLERHIPHNSAGCPLYARIREIHELARCVYTNDVMAYTLFLGAIMLGLSKRASRQQAENLREEIEGTVRNNADQTHSPEEGQILTWDKSATSPGVAPRENALTTWQTCTYGR